MTTPATNANAEELKATLDDYARHTDRCDLSTYKSPECTCGLDDIRNKNARPESKVCGWKYEPGCCYSTGCGLAIGKMESTGFRHCPFCGGKIEEKR